MKKIRVSILIMLLITNAIFVTGCWNYREVDKLAIVAGAAVDKKDGLYIITAEIIQIRGGKETKTTSEVVSMSGKTMFDAVRNGISVTGKRLYWSHSKILIISKDICGEGISQVVDWYIRDAETREDTNILISKETSAKEIFEKQSSTEIIKSMALDEIMKDQSSLSKAPVTDILQFEIDSKAGGRSTVIPTVRLEKINEKIAPQVIGTAIIKNDKPIGFLNGEETKDLSFIRNEVKGGVLVEGKQGDTVDTPVTLEIFSSKTKVTPVVDGNSIEMKIDVDITAALDEIEDKTNYIDEAGRTKLEHSTENSVKERIEALIRKVQSEYDADIFKFGAKLQEDNAKVWYRVRNNWDEIFKDLKVNVNTKVHIKNSAVISNIFEEGD